VLLCHRCIIFGINKSDQWKRRGVASAWFIESAISLRARMPEVKRSRNRRHRMHLLRHFFFFFFFTICLRVRQYPTPSRAHILRKACLSHPQDRAQLWNLPLRSQCCWKYVYYFNNHSVWIYDVERCFRVPAYDAIRRLRRKNRSRDQVLRAMIGAIIRDFLSGISIFNSHCISAS